MKSHYEILIIINHFTQTFLYAVYYVLNDEQYANSEIFD